MPPRPDPVSPPARFGLGVVAAAFGVQAVSIGLTIGIFPVLIEPVETEFGATRTQMSFGVPLVVLAAALCSPLIGRAVDRGAARGVMVSGALLLGAGLLVMSLAPSLAVLAAAWLLLAGTGQALLGPLPAMTVLARWFVARRTTMIAIAAMGTTFGGAVAPLVGELGIQTLGWRHMLVGLAIAAVAIGVPIALGIRSSPADVGLHPDGAAAPPEEPRLEGSGSARDILGQPAFWLLAGTFASFQGLGIGFITHVIPFAAERGIEREVAVGFLSVNALCSATGKLVFGMMADRLGPRRSTQIGVGLQLLGWLGLLGATDATSLGLSGACFSLGIGCIMPCQAGFVSRLFGAARFGEASGLIGLCALVGVVAVSPLMGLAYEASGSYDGPFGGVVGLIVAAGAMASWVRERPLAEASQVRSLGS